MRVLLYRGLYNNAWSSSFYSIEILNKAKLILDYFHAQKNKFTVEILVGTVHGSLNASGDASIVSPRDSAPVVLRL